MSHTSDQSASLAQLFDDWFGEVKKDLHKRGAFWVPTLVTEPIDARTVVLRSLLDKPTDLLADADDGQGAPAFIIHTDVRSEKWPQLTAQAACALHFYCPKRKWQMRVTARAHRHHQDAFATAQWQNLSARSRRIYALQQTPGTPVSDPQTAYAFDEGDEAAFQQFGVLRVVPEALESLQLERPDRGDYHVRAHWNVLTGERCYLAP